MVLHILHRENGEVKGFVMMSDAELYEAVFARRPTDQGVAEVAGVDRTTVLHWREKVDAGVTLRVNRAARKRMEDWLKGQPGDFERGYTAAIQDVMKAVSTLTPLVQEPDSVRILQNAQLLPSDNTLDLEAANRPDEGGKPKRAKGKADGG